MLDRLLDVLVVFGLRAGRSRSPAPPAWFREAADPRLAPTLHAIHAEPERTWTVDELAKLAHMSRATFARTFQQVLGQTPMKYLTDWRMTLARDLLLTSDATLEQTASQVGYSSVYAFTTAFHRHRGQPPRRLADRRAESHRWRVRSPLTSAHHRQCGAPGAQSSCRFLAPDDLTNPIELGQRSQLLA